jgi:catechol 2,3-dioxygenase-like lactoylglutathione lyase family enzyme
MPDPNPINVTRIDHVVIRCVAPEMMLAFYRDVLGCKLERGPGELGLLQLRAGDSLIDLIDISGKLGGSGEAPAPSAPNMDHVCLHVQPWDEAAILGHLAANGVKAGETASRYGATGQGPSIYLEDPEGNSVELKGTR